MSTDSPATQLATYPPRAVNVAAIERELSRLWEEPSDAPKSVTRACMSNLVILCGDPAQSGTLAGEVAEIVQEHPSRVLLLVADSSDTRPDLDAFVSAHCHLSGGRKQICSEYVMVTAGAPATARLASVARPLLIGDLPTGLWWSHHEPPVTGGDIFRELAGMADQVIYDSAGWSDPMRGLRGVADWVLGDAAGPAVADLAWRRLKRWRRLISQSLDPAVQPGALESIREVGVEHGPGELVSAWLLVGWLVSRLGWELQAAKQGPGANATWGFRSPAGPVSVVVRSVNERSAELERVALRWEAAGASQNAEFSAAGTERLVFGTDSAPARSIATPLQTRAMHVARQLPELHGDPVFLQALAVCRSMGQSLAR